MQGLVDALTKTPLPTILVVAGIVFLFLAIGGQLGARVSTKQLQPAYAAALGAILLAIGIYLQLVSTRQNATAESKRSEAFHPTPAAAETPRQLETPRYALRASAQPGRVLRAVWKQEMPNATITLEQGNSYITATESTAKNWMLLTDIMAANDGAPTVIRQTIQSDNRSTQLTLEGKEPTTQETKGPLVGATILFEWKNGSWEKSLVDKQPNAEEKAELDQQQFVNVDDIYPKEKVSPGYSWELKDQQLVHFLPNAFSIRGDALCAFEKIESHRGEKCAVITQHVDANFKMLVGRDEAAVEFGGNSTTYRSLDKLIDLETVMDGQMVIQTSQIINAQKHNVKIVGPLHAEVRTTDVTDEH